MRLKQRGWGEYVLLRALIDALLFPSDIGKVLAAYSRVFGSLPQLLRPRTFNEKLQRSKLFNRKESYTRFADKVAVRDFVRKRVGAEVLTKVFWIGTELAEARQQPLPNKFVIKANQSSGGILIVTDATTFDWDAACTLTRKWQEEDHSVHFAEWQYRWIPPKLLIEEYLEGEGGGVPLDYKFFCFHGRVEIIQVDFDRFVNHTRTLFDRDFNMLPVQYKYPRHERSVARPTCFEQMRQIAEHLAAGEPFLRIDLYDVGKPVFGELTLHPESGTGQFDPPEWDERLGALF